LSSSPTHGSPRTRSGLALFRAGLLVAWLAGLLVWRGAASLKALGGEVAGLEPLVLARALSSSPAERESRALRPLGAGLRALIEAHTPPRATVYFVGTGDPVETQRLWLGLSALLFPRLVLPVAEEKPLPRVPGTFVLAPHARAAALELAAPALAGHAQFGLWAVDR
jgi:hypothetical protein